MGRDLGILNISANFEPQIAAPFDGRTVVDTYADLTEVDTFISIDGNSYAYLGLVVSVIADSTPTNNGLYLLKAFPTTESDNWRNLSGGIAGVTPEYSDLTGYLVGDVISFVSPNAELLEEGDPLKESGLYECLVNTTAGESPEIAPSKWRYLGKVGETSGSTLITDITGLQGELNNRVRYTDIADNLKVGTDNKVKLDVTYLTLSGYSPVEDIQPDPIDEIKLNNTIWSLKNSVWTDGGEGIYTPRYYQLGLDAPVEDYGRFYTWAAAQRLVAANPGWRLPTVADYIDSFQGYFLPTAVHGDYELASGLIFGPESLYRTEPSSTGIWVLNMFDNALGLSFPQISKGGRRISDGILYTDRVQFSGTSIGWCGNFPDYSFNTLYRATNIGYPETDGISFAPFIKSGESISTSIERLDIVRLVKDI